jgi:hypothetical protein
MGAKTCFFDQAACTSMMVNESRAKERAALVKARDVTQLGPS